MKALNHESIKISWKGPEHSYFEKSADWFWITGGIALLLLIIAILIHNFLLGVLVIVSYSVFTLLAIKKPRNITFSIEPRGVKIGSKLYSYEEIDSFWINYDPPHIKNLLLKLKRTWNADLKIPLQNTDPNRVRNYLLNFLKEEKQEESLIETIAERLGF